VKVTATSWEDTNRLSIELRTLCFVLGSVDNQYKLQAQSRKIEAQNAKAPSSKHQAQSTKLKAPSSYTIPDNLEEAHHMDEFDRYRAAMNEKLTASDHLGIKRFFALDTQTYEDGALDKRTKELMGLVASTVLRCDDCITYHIKQCVQIGITRAEFLDAFNVALVVGGSITIPHLRRAIDRVDQLIEGRDAESGSKPPEHQH
jgi:AhpD family alkylhydroperoxidase